MVTGRVVIPSQLIRTRRCVAAQSMVLWVTGGALVWTQPGVTGGVLGLRLQASQTGARGFRARVSA